MITTLFSLDNTWSLCNMLRPLTVLYLVAFLDMFAASLISTVFSSYLLNELQLSSTVTGLVNSIYGTVQFFSSPAVGRLSDRWGCRVVLLGCLALSTISYTLLCCHWLVFVIASRTLAGVFKHTQNLCKSVIGAQRLSSAEQLSAYGRINAMGNIGFIIGPTLAGFLSSEKRWFLGGYKPVFLATAALFVLNACIVQRYFPADHHNYNWSPSASPSLVVTSGQQRSVVNGHPYDETSAKPEPSVMLDWRRQSDLMATRFLLSFAVLLSRSSLDVIVLRQFELSLAQVGHITSLQGLVSFVTSYHTKQVAALFKDTVTFYIAATAFMALSILGLALSAELFTFTGFLALFCAVTSCMRAVSYDLSSERAAQHEMGLVMGMGASVISAARAIGPAVGGVLYDLSADLPMLLSTALTALALGITVKLTKPRQILYNTRHEKTDKQHPP